MNQGIDHLARTTGGRPLCNHRRAHMSISIQTFRANLGTGRYCVRCLATLAKMDAIKARRECTAA